jgi:hypothetical protein
LSLGWEASEGPEEILHPSSFILHPLSFSLYPSAFILQPLSFSLYPSAFILQPSAFTKTIKDEG